MIPEHATCTGIKKIAWMYLHTQRHTERERESERERERNKKKKNIYIYIYVHTNARIDRSAYMYSPIQPSHVQGCNGFRKVSLSMYVDVK